MYFTNCVTMLRLPLLLLSMIESNQVVYPRTNEDVYDTGNTLTMFTLLSAVAFELLVNCLHRALIGTHHRTRLNHLLRGDLHVSAVV